MKPNDITYVTALYNLNRETLGDGFSRSMDHYYESFKKLLHQDIRLVIYCDKEVEQFVWKHRDSANTKVICRPIGLPFKKEVDKIRNTPEWYKQAGWLEQSPQAKLEYYNPLVMSKQFMLNDTTIHNYFGSKYFFWIDAGISNTVNVAHFWNSEQFDYKLIQDVKTNRMLYIAFPYDGQNEVHGFKKEGMNKFAGTDTEYVCRGGLFGGTRDAIAKINDVYYHTLANTLKEGYMGTEESVFTIISYQYPHYVNVQMIEHNGLIATYLERVKSRPTQASDEMALYFLTYNAPEQLKLCLSSFKDNFPRDFKNASKYLINNSTDKNLASAYNSICSEYELEEHKFDNIGITGGRVFAANHFDKSTHRYMVFFEDDMILNGPEFEGKICKAGFKKYDNDIFEKSIMIIEENELDYLKLTFSEFFGVNHDNWTWTNMDEQSKKIHLKNDDCMENTTRSFYTGCYKQLAYSVGEYFYCNWPIVFTKRGNRKFFIEACTDPRMSESSLMAKMQTLLRAKTIKSGILLASPITHRRVKYYKNARVENHY